MPDRASSTRADPPAASPRRLPTAREAALAWLHLAAVCAFAIAQPLLHQLGNAPAFFAAHDSTRWEVIGFGVVLAAGPPTILLALEVLAGLAWPPARRITHRVLMALALALFVLQHLQALPTVAAFVVAIIVGAGLCAIYVQERWARSMASVLAIAPALFLLLFVFASPVKKLTLESTAQAFTTNGTSTPPIIFVQLDAFPLDGLLAPDGSIDATRYPNFARLAGTSTWYRNATTAHENTVLSVPSILDGRTPHGQPILADHPNNLFTLLGRAYHVDAYQSVTSLCPPALCTSPEDKSASSRLGLLADDTTVVYEHSILPHKIVETLPSITESWRDFRAAQRKPVPDPKTVGLVLSELAGGTRPQAFREMVARMKPEARPLLSYMHILLPHEPRQYLPSGREYQAGADLDPSLDGWPSFRDEFLSEQALQRSLLQNGFVDRLLGEMIDHLERVGMWNKAMVVLVADHGESFQRATHPVPEKLPGALSWRRAVTPQNVEHIAPVPLFVKYPGQTKGAADGRYVKTIDVLPTIAQTLGIRLPFHVDGSSLKDPAYHGHADVAVGSTAGGAVHIAIPELERRRQATRDREAALFGTGDGGPGLFGIGPAPELHGKALSDLRVVPGAGLTARLEHPRELAHVNLRTAAGIPADVTGFIDGGDPAGHDLAIAVNGRVVATGVSFAPIGQNRVSFSVMIPDSSLRQGANDVRVFEIASDASGTVLRRLPPAG